MGDVLMGREGRIVLSAVGLALLLLVTAGRGALAQEEKAVARVVAQRGGVTALQGTLPRALHLGALLFQGDRIVTGRDSRVKILFADQSSLSIGAGTEIELSEYLRDGEGRTMRAVLSLLRGIVRATLALGERPRDFEIKTETVVASVRSTDWLTEAKEDRTSVFVVTGRVKVAVLDGGAEVDLDEGFGTDVEVGAAPTAPKRWGVARVESVLARTRVP
jgi:hypothetical protein